MNKADFYAKAFAETLSLRKIANFDIQYKNGYVYCTVDRPKYDLPLNLKDRGEFHITIISPLEVLLLKSLGKDSFEDVIKKEIAQFKPGAGPQYIGLGKQSNASGDVVYFVVVNWPEAQKFRNSLGLSNADLHITMGFSNEDIHGVPKDKTTLM